MNVLSLFDGMSCGQIALERAGIEYNNYFASEIDEHAIKVTQHNYPNTIQLGSVTDLKGEDLPKIDLLIGGSPCQDFSSINRVSKGIEGERSGLFWEYVRLIKECKPTYFLLENVMMNKKYLQIITNELGVEPFKICSSLVSAQRRPRWYWTNIGELNYNLLGTKTNLIDMPKDKNIAFKDILEDLPFKPNTPMFDRAWGKIKRKELSNCVTNYKSNCLTTRNTHAEQYLMNKDRTHYRSLSVLEFERLQTVPEGYTKNVAKTHAYKMLGNGWTVDVIAHIFKNIKTD